MHKLELKIGDREHVYTNAIDTRVKNYLRLVFPCTWKERTFTVDGSYVHKQIDIFYNGRDMQQINPLISFTVTAVHGYYEKVQILLKKDLILTSRMRKIRDQ